MLMQKSNEWYTPAYIIDAAREVMGGIELDPASCALAQETVRAERYYSKEDDGLSQEWKAKTVWLNPPFGRVHPERKGSTKSYQVFFMRKLLEEYQSCRTKQAVALVFGTSCCMPWFQTFWQFPVCLLSKHTEFDKADGNKGYFGYGLVFVYLGPDEQKFIEVFSKFGTVVRRVS